MEYKSSRRIFLRNSAIATTGIAFLSSTTFANSLTSKTSPFEGDNPYAEEKTDLRSSSLFGKHITVKGKIFDSTGTFVLSNVTVEVWHLSPNSRKFKHKAKLKTNVLGAYFFVTDFPNKEIGKCSRIYFKVSNGTSNYFTELLITNSDAYISEKHWEENNQLGENLFPIKEGTINSSTITFNRSI